MKLSLHEKIKNFLFSFIHRTENENLTLQEGQQFCINLPEQQRIAGFYSGGSTLRLDDAMNLILNFYICLYKSSLNILGSIVTRDKKLLGIYSYGYNGLPKVCTLSIGYREFISNPKVIFI